MDHSVICIINDM